MITHYAANGILNHIGGKSDSIDLNGPQGAMYLALSSTEPQVDGTNITEPVGGNYTRQRFGSSMASATNGSITNDGEIHFLEVESSWGTLYYACIVNSSTVGGGQLIAWGELGSYVDSVWTPAPITPTANSVVVIKPGDLNISIT